LTKSRGPKTKKPTRTANSGDRDRHIKKQPHEYADYFQVLIENALDAIAIVSSDGILTYESPAFERMLGWTPEDHVGTSPFGFVHEDDLPSMAAVFAHLVETPGATAHEELRVWHKDGSLRHIEVIGQNLLDNPAVAGIVANLRDITSRKQVEEALKKAHDKLEMRVQERTRDLAAANKKLRKEIRERKTVI
jgi:PAS domain S-box-containing protein